MFPGVEPNDNVVFIGLDTRETMAYLICKHSIEQRSPGVKVFPLYTKALRQAGLYSRPLLVEGTTGQFVDVIETRPHSVDFSFTRFLVPYISRLLGLKGYSIFMDCDFLVLEDLNKLFTELNNSYSERPVAVVKHQFPTYTDKKMDGCLQVSYEKKLWSALMCFNTQHYLLDSLTPEKVSTMPGLYLHKFQWLPTEDVLVGLPEEYQFIPDHSEDNTLSPPKIIHYTEKAPWFTGINQSCSFSGIWWDEVEAWKKTVATTPKCTRIWE